ncbi:hypothetical protein F441_14660, partial [Phytophthora nicotianae CJ01A1]
MTSVGTRGVNDDKDESSRNDDEHRHDKTCMVKSVEMMQDEVKDGRSVEYDLEPQNLELDEDQGPGDAAGRKDTEGVTKQTTSDANLLDELWQCLTTEAAKKDGERAARYVAT